jgi:glycosyltransferase involved in cell wall biosynthesis
MKVISIGTGTNIFDPNSSAYRRVVEYGKIFEELHIIVFAPADRFTNQKLAPNVFLYPTNSKFELLYIFDYLRVVKSILSKTGNRDVVFSTQDPFETGLVGLWLKLKYGLPLHIQLHTDFANRYYWTHSLINFVRFLLAHFTLPFADGVRCVSKKIAEDVQELNPNVSVLPISQDFILTNDLVDSKEFKGRLLTVCRLEKEKNLTVAIKAFALLNKKFPESIFTIVGDGSQKKELMKLADSLGLATKVIFVGWQNNTEDFYKNADAYISTSLFEGYGISLMAAVTIIRD